MTRAVPERPAPDQSAPAPPHGPLRDAAAFLNDLQAMPLYLKLHSDISGVLLGRCADAWPAWREALLAARPKQKPATADVILLNALLWPVGTLHLGAAFLRGARLLADVRVTPAPGGTGALLVGVNTAALQQQEEDHALHAALAELLGVLDALAPVARARPRLLLDAACDRLVQVLLVLGQATGDDARAAAWTEQLVAAWPRQSGTRVTRREGAHVLVRASCCYHYLDHERCSACPLPRGGRSKCRVSDKINVL